MTMSILVVLALCLTLGMSEERDCDTAHWRMLTADTCNLKIGPICPQDVAWCDEREAKIVRREVLYNAQKGAALLARFLALPHEWQQYASLTMPSVEHTKRVFGCLDARCLGWDEIDRVAGLETALQRAETHAHPGHAQPQGTTEKKNEEKDEVLTQHIPIDSAQFKGL